MNKSTDLVRKKSRIHGWGIFATRDIKKGERFYRVPIDVISCENKFRWAHIGEGRYVCDKKVLNWVNHSCEPNIILFIEKDLPMLIARKNILAGEEIVCDYNKTEIEKPSFHCNCQGKKCRK